MKYCFENQDLFLKGIICDITWIQSFRGALLLKDLDIQSLDADGENRKSRETEILEYYKQIL